jgi:hypothetical protein
MNIGIYLDIPVDRVDFAKKILGLLTKTPPIKLIDKESGITRLFYPKVTDPAFKVAVEDNSFKVSNPVA